MKEAETSTRKSVILWTEDEFVYVVRQLSARQPKVLKDDPNKQSYRNIQQKYWVKMIVRKYFFSIVTNRRVVKIFFLYSNIKTFFS